MKPYFFSYQEAIQNNKEYRKVIRTTHGLQTETMHPEVSKTIPMKTHELNQIIMVMKGEVIVITDGTEHHITEVNAVVIPRDTHHEVRQHSNMPTSLFSVYGPPGHKDATVHQRQGIAKEEHFDGVISS